MNEMIEAGMNANPNANTNNDPVPLIVRLISLSFLVRVNGSLITVILFFNYYY